MRHRGKRRHRTTWALTRDSRVVHLVVGAADHGIVHGTVHELVHELVHDFIHLSIDPVTTDANTGGSFNRYAYAANNPFRYTDPDGRQERAAEGFSDAMARDPKSMEAFGPAAAVVTGVMAAPVIFELGMAALANPVAVNSAVVMAGEAVGVTGTAGAAAVAGKEAVAVAGKITGYTTHGLNQAISRDGGRGVSPKAILSAVRSPTKVTEQAGGKIAYTGKDARVVLNADGRVITVIPKNSEALRDPKVK